MPDSGPPSPGELTYEPLARNDDPRPDFHVGPFVYRLEITARHPRMADGSPVVARVDFDRQVIQLWAGLTGDHRLHHLQHELGHIWDHLAGLGINLDEESRHDRNAFINTQFIIDLDRIGGRTALAELPVTQKAAAVLDVDPDTDPPGSTPDRGTDAADEGVPHQDDDPDARIRLVPVPEDEPAMYADDGDFLKASADRRDCASCGVPRPEPFIHTDAPVFLKHTPDGRSIQGVVVHRLLYCPRCDQVQHWVEGTDADGQPNGVRITAPELITHIPNLLKLLERYPRLLRGPDAPQPAHADRAEPEPATA